MPGNSMIVFVKKERNEITVHNLNLNKFEGAEFFSLSIGLHVYFIEPESFFFIFMFHEKIFPCLS